MLRCNLSVLLAERGLKITEVSNETGISRTTLTSLASNANQGLHLDTINKLCIFLRVKPEEFFEFVSFDIEPVIKQFKVIPESFACEFNMNLIISDKARKTEFEVMGYVRPFPDIIDLHTLKIEIFLDPVVNLETLEDDNSPAGLDLKKLNDELISYFRLLPASFLADLQEKIESKIIALTPLEYRINKTRFLWPSEFYN